MQPDTVSVCLEGFVKGNRMFGNGNVIKKCTFTRTRENVLVQSYSAFSNVLTLTVLTVNFIGKNDTLRMNHNTKTFTVQ